MSALFFIILEVVVVGCLVECQWLLRYQLTKLRAEGQLGKTVLHRKDRERGREDPARWGTNSEKVMSAKLL